MHKLKDYTHSFSWNSLRSDWEQVLSELKGFGVSPKVDIWPSTEWFCPDGVAGIAVPFYLYNKSLQNKLKKYGLRVEGTTKKERLKLLRHELAHALDNIYGLRMLKKRQQLFGVNSKSYPHTFTPIFDSGSNYVNHLDETYGQSHPSEDWAETMAYIIGGGNISELKGSAKNKAIYVLEVLQSLKFRRQRKCLKCRPDELSTDMRSIEEFILEKQNEEIFTPFNNFSKKVNRLHEEKGVLIEEVLPKPDLPSWVLENIMNICRATKVIVNPQSRKTKNFIDEVINSSSKNWKQWGVDKVVL